MEPHLLSSVFGMIPPQDIHRDSEVHPESSDWKTAGRRAYRPSRTHNYRIELNTGHKSPAKRATLSAVITSVKRANE